MEPAADDRIRLVGFDGDDTLWRSEDYFDDAQRRFEAIVGAYVDLDDSRAREHLYTVEKGNLALFGYGVKGMALSMIEAAVDITGARISAADLHRIVQLAKDMLQHPVELLPGIREAVEAIAAEHRIVLITKGDLFHQENKVRRSGLADLFGRIEIVSEKDPATYARVLGEFGIAPPQFVMVGNSLRSDIAPVLQLGGWAVHMPYHLTWAHEREAGPVDGEGERRLRTVATPQELPAAVRQIVETAETVCSPSPGQAA
ncbi:HAD family hydrolase [Luteimonas sp. R10]|uniref:HAD family hydrolase n=1 Tax=Luteimonas sp. R10 TaxID=3108176 RepID=UPI0030898715|nr:HAD family hydrolase [Luteimonas sp. R10]